MTMVQLNKSFNRTRESAVARFRGKRRHARRLIRTLSYLREAQFKDHLADPHSALAWAALDQSLEPGEEGIFLCTAHPAKFLEVIEETLGINIPLPPELEEVKDKQVLSSTIPGNFTALREALLDGR